MLALFPNLPSAFSKNSPNSPFPFRKSEAPSSPPPPAAPRRRRLASMADRLLLLILVVAAASALVAPPIAAAARPCDTFLISSNLANANPSNDPDQRAPLTTSVITVFRVRRFGPHLLRAHGRAQPHLNHHHHHLHSIPANIQIRHPELPVLPHSAAGAAASIQERFNGILMVVFGILTAASVYLVWSVITATGALSHYDELYGDEAFDSESPKKVGYAIISSEAHGGGKN